jgi:hypothetical protein
MEFTMSEELNDGSKRRYDEKLHRVDESVVKQIDTTDDQRPGVTDVMFERDTVIDVLSGLPAGHSIDQTLGLGLDGAPISTARNHFGVGDDDLLTGRSTDSPESMARENLFGDSKNDGPPGMQTGSANPTRNMDLVSGEDGGTKGPIDTVVDAVKDLFKDPPPPPPPPPVVRPEGDTPVPKPKAGTMPQPGTGWMTNPDADTGGTGGTVTEDDVQQAIAKQGFDTDFVEGFGRGPAVTSDSPTKRPIDLVRDPVDDDQTGVAVTVVSSDLDHVPQDEISHTVNPDDGLGGLTLTPTAPPSGSGDGDGAFTIGMQTDDHSVASDSFSVDIDESMQMQDSLDSVFDGALASQQQPQQQQDGAGAQGDGALGDDGF